MKNNLEIALEKSTIIAELKLENEELQPLNIHRNYNVDDTKILEHILNQLGEARRKNNFPCSSENKKNACRVISISKNIQMTEPSGYLDFIVLENSAKRIITDSGGIQKEAYILQKAMHHFTNRNRMGRNSKRKMEFIDQSYDKKIASKIECF